MRTCLYSFTIHFLLTEVLHHVVPVGLSPHCLRTHPQLPCPRLVDPPGEENPENSELAIIGEGRSATRTELEQIWRKRRSSQMLSKLVLVFSQVAAYGNQCRSKYNFEVRFLETGTICPGEFSEFGELMNRSRINLDETHDVHRSLVFRCVCISKQWRFKMLLREENPG